MGNLYIADQFNQRIRMVNTSGIISTIVGTGTAGSLGDGGLATAAEINSPSGIVLDAAGNLYIADQANSRIRKVNTSGIISTIAGTGAVGYAGDGGLATAATLNNPHDITIDPTGNIYFSDFGNNCVRKISTSNIITTVAGTGAPGFTGDGGPAIAAKLLQPEGLSISSGNIYITDNGNQRISKINSTGTISTFARTGVSGFSGDLGPPTSAQLQNPIGVTFDALGNLFIGDCNNNRIRKITAVSAGNNCPTPISVAAKDSATGASISSGSTVSCMAKQFYVYANVSSANCDSMNGLFIPNIQIRLIYQAGLNTYGKIEEYEGGVFVGCWLGTGGSTGSYTIGAPTCSVTTSGVPGQWWWTWNTCLPGGIDPTKQHDFVFSNTNVTTIANSVVVIKYPRTSQAINTSTWNLASPGSYTVSIPANTNIGQSAFSINPTPTNTLAVKDLKDGRFRINPKLLALGTYTVTYTFSDTLCSGILALDENGAQLKKIDKVYIATEEEKMVQALVKDFKNGFQYKILASEHNALKEVYVDDPWLDVLNFKGNETTIQENVFYGSGEYKLNSAGLNILDKVILVFKSNSKISIEIGSHTDSKGNDDFNLSLSKRRAMFAADYFISHGLSSSRVKGIGFGETKIKNKCGNDVTCTDEEHAKNRRTEFRIFNTK